MFLNYKVEVKNQLDRKIKRLRFDRGGEYGITFLKEFCENNGIIHETSASYTPQQNGIAERKNRTLKEMMNAMLISSGLSDYMQGEAVLSANYVLNKVPHNKLDKTPYELWKGHGPNLKYLRVQGYLAKVAFPSDTSVANLSKVIDRLSKQMQQGKSGSIPQGDVIKLIILKSTDYIKSF